MGKDSREEGGQGGRDPAMPALLAGVCLFLLEIWKQLYLYFIYFGHAYDIWYFPFQLCSLPMYLSLLYLATLRWDRRKASGARKAFSTRQTRNARKASNAGHRAKLPSAAYWRTAILVFLQDFGLLGGVAALLVPDGFTHPDHPLLTLHGYLWHITMVGMAVFIIRKRLAEAGFGGFRKGLSVFLLGALLAELLDILLHPLGDCDMFYISPYHPSSQIVFHDIDLAIGRPLGILLYLFAIALAAFLIHTCLGCCHIMGKR